ncbi:hypothetical protein B5X24_HaOG207108 [Helicoverpa armigera]|uniref:Uncharacterized protein n=1 Tax=Helicoverpa armigera TaxID=29058 RepID=A0A2W1BMK3_HELAM|nr:hypothetical protein B5X24_HaOG207108 [Helicoverpa armigera]
MSRIGIASGHLVQRSIIPVLLPICCREVLGESELAATAVLRIPVSRDRRCESCTAPRYWLATASARDILDRPKCSELEPRSLDVAEGADQECASAHAGGQGYSFEAGWLEEGLAVDATMSDSENGREGGGGMSRADGLVRGYNILLRTVDCSG